MNYPEKWTEFFEQESEKLYFQKLMKYVEQEYATKIIYPPKQMLFEVFNLIGPEEIEVIILGQDPYPKMGQANGIAFSSGNHQTPKSLNNMFKELYDDLGIDHFKSNDLSGWVEQGVFLVNSVLTVEANEPLSNENIGWEIFTQNLLIYLSSKPRVFCAFGNHAYEIYSKITTINPQNIIRTGHPSPLSYYRYFKGSQPFSQINAKLLTMHLEPIDWSK